MANIQWNQQFFDNFMKTPEVTAMVKRYADQAANAARASAPTKSYDYQRSIQVVPTQFRYRNGFQVVAYDPKALVIEARTGNLARALRGVTRG